MGEAKRRRDAGEPLWRWLAVRDVPPPDDAVNLAVRVTITCECGKGGRLSLPAGRLGGEWVIGGFDHSFDLTHWLRLPAFPETLH